MILWLLCGLLWLSRFYKVGPSPWHLHHKKLSSILFLSAILSVTIYQLIAGLWRKKNKKITTHNTLLMQNLVFWNTLQEFDSDRLTLHLVWRNCGPKHISSGGVSGNFPSITLFKGKEISLSNVFYGNYFRVVQVSMSVRVNMSVSLLLAASFPPEQTLKRWINKKENQIQQFAF